MSGHINQDMIGTQTCKEEYASTFEGKGVRVKSVVTLCTHLARPKCSAVQMNCSPVKDAQVLKCGVANVLTLTLL